MHNEFWREESISREPGQEINARIQAGDLGWRSAMGRERRGLQEAQNRMLSEKRKSSKSPSIYSSKGREN